MGELGYEWGMSRGSGGGDMFNFSATEIPAMTLTQGLTAWLHTSRDSLETCTVDAFHAPLAFARSLLEWAGSDAQIVQGYPPDLKNESVAYGHRFGWGVQA